MIFDINSIGKFDPNFFPYNEMYRVTPSETIARKLQLISPCCCFQGPCNWFMTVLNHLVNHQNTQLNAEYKNQIQAVLEF